MKRYLIALGVLVLALAACVVLIQAIEAAGPNEARVRVVHAVPDGPGVDIKVDSMQVYTNVTYTTVTPYATLLTGTHLVQVFVHPSSPIPVLLISETMFLAGGMDLTVAGVGQYPAITSTVLVDNNHPANANTVRVVNFSPDTPAIDVTITGTLTSTVVSGIPYKGASSYIGGLGVGEASFEVRASGEITTLLTFTGTLESDTINTFFIMGLKDSLTQVHSIDQRWPFKVFLPLITKGG
jgi:hypothetical protein